MYSTFHFTSAQEINTDILDAIKTVYKSKSITNIVEEDDEEDFNLNAELKTILEERSQENEETYLTAEASINQLTNKYGL